MAERDVRTKETFILSFILGGDFRPAASGSAEPRVRILSICFASQNMAERDLKTKETFFISILGGNFRLAPLGRRTLGFESFICFASQNMAEREGFEPPLRLLVNLISSQTHSTTLPPLLPIVVGCRPSVPNDLDI